MVKGFTKSVRTRIRQREGESIIYVSKMSLLLGTSTAGDSKALTSPANGIRPPKQQRGAPV